MSDNNEDILKEYQALFQDDNFETVLKKLETMKEHKHFNVFVYSFCNEILDKYTSNYTHYPDKLTKYDKYWRELYNKTVKLISDDGYYFQLVDAFFQGNRKAVKRLIAEYEASLSKNGTQDYSEAAIVSAYINVFKNAYPSFYNMLADILENNNFGEDIVALCRVIEEYYHYKETEDRLSLMLSFSANYNELILPKELIALCYFNMKMWNNALAYFEQIEGKSVLYYLNEIYFMMAWCSGKAKNYSDEELYYKKALEINFYTPWARNNLGFSFYRQKRYDEAKKVFEECFELNMDIECAASNYVRTLLAMGLNKDAKEFINSGKYKVYKFLQDKVKKSDGRNHKKSEKNHTVIPEFTDEQAEVIELRTPIDIVSKSKQFSSEKILEDELTARIESGTNVFGIKLKVWKRRGEYGRQFILPTGKRIDLLCENENGDIYIIELKKDSGYDDPYKQIVEYIEWFENSKKYKDKKIFGIICLNNPTESLLKKVHSDSRIRLFEYQISYLER